MKTGITFTSYFPARNYETEMTLMRVSCYHCKDFQDIANMNSVLYTHGR